jgi:hypothetical protein
MRIVVYDSPRGDTALGALGQVPMLLSDATRQALSRLQRDDAELVLADPGDYDRGKPMVQGHVDAVLWEVSDWVRPEWRFRDRWRGVPFVFACFVGTDPYAIPPDWPGEPVRGAGIYYLETTDPQLAVSRIAEWLDGELRPVLTARERQKLEVVVAALYDALENRSHQLNDPPQLQAAADTIQAQLRATRPSRKVLAWALEQVQHIPVGLITGLALPYLQDLLHAMR